MLYRILPLPSLMIIFLLLMVISSSINSDRGLPLMITLSPLISTVILVSFSPFLRMIISWVSFFPLSPLSPLTPLSSWAVMLVVKAAKHMIAAVKTNFFMTLYFKYEMFSRSNVVKIFELRNYSQINIFL